jgi:hypothetical protein
MEQLAVLEFKLILMLLINTMLVAVEVLVTLAMVAMVELAVAEAEVLFLAEMKELAGALL